MKRTMIVAMAAAALAGCQVEGGKRNVTTPEGVTIYGTTYEDSPELGVTSIKRAHFYRMLADAYRIGERAARPGQARRVFKTLRTYYEESAALETGLERRVKPTSFNNEEMSAAYGSLEVDTCRDVLAAEGQAYHDLAEALRHGNRPELERHALRYVQDISWDKSKC